MRQVVAYERSKRMENFMHAKLSGLKVGRGRFWEVFLYEKF